MIYWDTLSLHFQTWKMDNHSHHKELKWSKHVKCSVEGQSITKWYLFLYENQQDLIALWWQWWTLSEPSDPGKQRWLNKFPYRFVFWKISAFHVWLRWGSQVSPYDKAWHRAFKFPFLLHKWLTEMSVPIDQCG